MQTLRSMKYRVESPFSHPKESGGHITLINICSIISGKIGFYEDTGDKYKNIGLNTNS